MKTSPNPSSLFKSIRSGNRVLLAKAITLVESSLDADRLVAAELISLCLPYCGNSKRIALSGIPGVGKSSLIEVIGTRLTDEGKKVAVLTIDPSSSISGGSILGDKTRMNQLSANPLAFIRPSPSSGIAGGVALRTRESIFLCEAAGYEYIFVETVGVGQSEISAASMTDMFILLLLARAGDELQGIKRGIVEMADAFVVSKADGNHLAEATLAKSHYTNAVSLIPSRHGGWNPQVLTCSAVTGDGVSGLLDHIDTFFEFITRAEILTSLRNAQNVSWLHETVNEEIYSRFYRNPKVVGALPAIEQNVAKGNLSVYDASSQLLKIAGLGGGG